MRTVIWQHFEAAQFSAAARVFAESTKIPFTFSTCITKALLAIALAVFFVLPISPLPASAGEMAMTNSVDDLFAFLCNLRYVTNAPYPPVEPEIIYSVASIPTSESTDAILIPDWKYSEPRRFGDSDFAAAIAGAEYRFGHLAEYWELLAQAGASNSTEFNTLFLRRAVDINPERIPAHFYMLLSGSERAFPPKSRNIHSIFDTINPYSIDATRTITEYEIENTILDNRNSFYPIIYAICLAHENDVPESIDMLGYASSVTIFEPPLLFPWDYLTESLDSAAKLEGVFGNIGAAATNTVYTEYRNICIFDVLGVKEAYSLLIEASMESTDWKKRLTILHRAALKFEDSNSNFFLNALISHSLRGACRNYAMKRAYREGDTNLQMALIALLSQEQNQLGYFRGFNTSNASISGTSTPEFLRQFDEVSLTEESSGEISDWIRKWQARINIDNSSMDNLDVLLPKYREQVEMISSFEILTGGSNAVLRVFNERESLKQFNRNYSRPPVSEFDFENPSDWYRKWLTRRGILIENNQGGV